MNYKALALAAPLFIVTGCNDNDSNQRQAQAQEASLAQATNAVGMPAIVNWQERRMLKQVLELRDQAIATTTYIIDMNGKLHKVCDSIGYGIPYSTQYTSPEYVTYIGGSYRTMPQADPNGLFPPASAEGTWVNCVDPATKQAKVVYIEPKVIASPFPLAMQ